MGDDSDGKEFFAVVAAFHHETVYETFNNGHLSLLELFFGITACSVGHIYGMSDLDVVGQRDVAHFNVLGFPFTEQFHVCSDFADFFGQGRGGHGAVGDLVDLRNRYRMVERRSCIP